MSDASSHPYLAAGLPVVDRNGEALGTIRAVYPHYVAVAEHAPQPMAYRVPFRAIVAFDGATVRLGIPRDVLDPMTPQERAAFGLPEHGGEIPVGTGTAESEADAGFSFGQRQIGDGEPGERSPEDAASLDEALARDAIEDTDER